MKENINKKKYKISIILNCIIVLFVIVASIMMFSGYRFMNGDELVLESSKLGMFKFFTVDSNIFMGIISLIFVIYEIKLLNGKINDIPNWLYNLKLMATTGVTLTFFVVLVYLGPLVSSMRLMFMNSNLFFHLFVPVFSIISFILYEKNNKLKLINTFYGLIPVVLYTLFYLFNVLIHIENGIVSTKYDFYWFVQKGMWTSIIVIPLMLIIAYCISFILWKLNKNSK